MIGDEVLDRPRAAEAAQSGHLLAAIGNVIRHEPPAKAIEMRWRRVALICII
jgi:hypothetical protein